LSLEKCIDNWKIIRMTPQPFPSTVFKYCPRCGSHNFLTDTPKSLTCSDCGFQYFINVAAAVAGLIYDKESRLLMTYRSHDPAKGKLDLPGGFVDRDEDAFTALKREIREELNLEVMDMEYYASFPNEYLYGGLIYQTLDLVFTCKVNSLVSIKEADDVCGYTFMELPGIPIEEIGLQSVKNIIELLKKS
jgi:NAD+ diphosphatase